MKVYYVCHTGYAAWAKRRGLSSRSLHGNTVPVQLVTRAGVVRAVRELEAAFERSQIAILYLDVPKKWLKCVRSLTYECQRDIPPERVKGELFLEG